MPQSFTAIVITPLQAANIAASGPTREDWYISRNERVYYAYEVAVQPCKLDYAIS